MPSCSVGTHPTSLVWNCVTSLKLPLLLISRENRKKTEEMIWRYISWCRTYVQVKVQGKREEIGEKRFDEENIKLNISLLLITTIVVQNLSLYRPKINLEESNDRIITPPWSLDNIFIPSKRPRDIQDILKCYITFCNSNRFISKKWVSSSWKVTSRLIFVTSFKVSLQARVLILC